MSCSAPLGTAAADWLAHGLTLTRQPERARACFVDAAIADPLSHEPPMQLGRALLAAGAPLAQVASHLERAALLAAKETNHSAAASLHSMLGDAQASVGDLVAAAGSYGQALARSPASCAVSAALAQVQVELGQLVAAAAVLRAALAEDHACVLAHQVPLVPFEPP